jgi:LmbE family N-acetylglucosaminyl deacetylase
VTGPDWLRAWVDRGSRPLHPGGPDVAGPGRLVVIAAHPDDETLAAGGLIQAAHAAGADVELVVATDGEAAFPGQDGDARAELAAARRGELDRALAAHGLAGVPVHRLGLPDSGLAERAGELAERLRPLLAGADAYLAPWTGDPHPDHAAAGRAAAEAAPVTAHGLEYPIWMWVRCAPDDPGIPWDRAFHHDLTPGQRARKLRAVRCFDTQLAPAPDGGPPILPPEVLAHFDVDRELYFRAAPADSAPATRFDELYTAGDGDPWGTRSSWYERRKRAVLLACLPRERYRHVAEPGCGLGELTRELAGRCDRLHASDYSAPAVAAARDAVAGTPGVVVERAALPDPAALPDGLDLAVVSEVLYYLSPEDVRATVHRLADALVPGGDVVLAHWRGWPAEAPRDAAATHADLLDDPRFVTLVEHVDAEFLLHLARRR